MIDDVRGIIAARTCYWRAEGPMLNVVIAGMAPKSFVEVELK